MHASYLGEDQSHQRIYRYLKEFIALSVKALNVPEVVLKASSFHRELALLNMNVGRKSFKERNHKRNL